MTETLLTPEQVSERLAISAKTLANWRSLCIGPAYVKVGAVVRYLPQDVDAFVRSARVVTA